VRPEVALPLTLALALFVRGAWRLRRCRRAGIGLPRLLAAAVGFTALGVALSNPVHALGHALFTAHMAQHLLLVAIAAPALALADPFAVTLWGLPPRARRALGALLVTGHPVRRALAGVTRMGVTWPLYVAVLWLWHAPTPYDAALRSGLLHDVEHVLFFGAALLFWWPVLGPGPRLAPLPHPAARVAYLVLGALQSAALGLLLATRPEPLYATYVETAPAWGIAPADDQVWGGVLMWSVGAAVDMLAVLGVVASALKSPAFLDRSTALRDNWPA
jgi:cytochrome c oxidase assembly factor CtaG